MTPDETRRRDILGGCILAGMIARGEVMPDVFDRMLEAGIESEKSFDLPMKVKQRFVMATTLAFGLAEDIVRLLPRLMDESEGKDSDAQA
ncbi:MAG TPA: hypothetical protein VM389_03040 [Phycisphaerae bacterium]|nr:hypothetical protein [Phycisphaerae bacterium]HUU59297.1 hypothetical protein [Phycisphaerae bacterium]